MFRISTVSGISGVDDPRTFVVAVVIPTAAFTFSQEVLSCRFPISHHPTRCPRQATPLRGSLRC